MAENEEVVGMSVLGAGTEEGSTMGSRAAKVVAILGGLDGTNRALGDDGAVITRGCEGLCALGASKAS